LPKKIKRCIFNHFRDNFLVYFIVTIIFITGIIIGSIAIKLLESQKITNIMFFLNSLFRTISSDGIDNVSVLKQSLADNYKLIFIIWISSIMFIGLLIVPIIVLFKGFALGFSVGFFVNEYGFNGFLFSLLGIFSQNIFIIPGIISISSLSLAFSISNVRRKKLRTINGKFVSNFIDYSLLVILYSVLVLIGCLIEAYLAPIFMNSFIEHLY